jgi:hypothetical protein
MNTENKNMKREMKKMIKEWKTNKKKKHLREYVPLTNGSGPSGTRAWKLVQRRQDPPL